MNYAKEIAAIIGEKNVLALATRRLGWGLGRCVPGAITHTATARLDTMKESEPFRRLPPSEHARVQREIEQEETAARALAAGVARRNVEPLAASLKERLRVFVAARRADTSLSFPNALAGVDPNGMIMLGILQEALRPTVEAAEPAALLQMYTRGMKEKTARGRIVCELIEQRTERGGLARSETQIPIVKELADAVDGWQGLRVPIEDLKGVEETIRDAERSIVLADTARVRAANPEREPAAKEAYERDEAGFRADLAAREAAGQ